MPDTEESIWPPSADPRDMVDKMPTKTLAKTPLYQIWFGLRKDVCDAKWNDFGSRSDLAFAEDRFEVAVRTWADHSWEIRDVANDVKIKYRRRT